MKKLKLFIAIIAVATVFALTPATRTFAESAETITGSNLNANLIILTPGHSRSIYYELNDIIYNDINAIHTTFIITLGTGLLNVSISKQTFTGEGTETIFATSGFLGLTPVLNYAYGSGLINLSSSLTDSSVNFGVLFTTVMAGVGGPDFPVSMNEVFSLIPAAQE